MGDRLIEIQHAIFRRRQRSQIPKPLRSAVDPLQAIGGGFPGIFLEQGFAVLDNEKGSAAMCGGIFCRLSCIGQIKVGGSGRPSQNEQEAQQQMDSHAPTTCADRLSAGKIFLLRILFGLL
jgi:hypothetical protein